MRDGSGGPGGGTLKDPTTGDGGTFKELSGGIPPVTAFSSINVFVY